MYGCERERNGNPLQYSCLENPTGSQRVRHDWVTKLQQHGHESWTIKKAGPPKNWCFWTVVLETLESPLDSKETKPVKPKGNQSWMFTGRTDAEAEPPILWPPDAKNWLIGKDPDAGKDWKHEEKGTTEDEIIGWHHRLDGHEFEQAPGVGNGQESLVCCSPWGHKELDTTEWLNWMFYYFKFVPTFIYTAFLVAQTVKHLPAMRETWVRSLGWEDPLEKEMATYSSTLAWKIPWMEEPGRLQPIESKSVRHNWVTSISIFNLIYTLIIEHWVHFCFLCY